MYLEWKRDRSRTHANCVCARARIAIVTHEIHKRCKKHGLFLRNDSSISNGLKNVGSSCIYHSHFVSSRSYVVTAIRCIKRVSRFLRAKSAVLSFAKGAYLTSIPIDCVSVSVATSVIFIFNCKIFTHPHTADD